MWDKFRALAINPFTLVVFACVWIALGLSADTWWVAALDYTMAAIYAWFAAVRFGEQRK